MGKVLYTQQPYCAVCFVEPAPIHFVHHYLHTFHIYVLCDTSSLFYSLCSIVLVSHRAWSSENRIALIVLVLKVRLIVVLLFSKISTTLLIRGVLNTEHARMSARLVHFLGCSKSSIPKPLQSEHVRACSVLELWCSWA